MITRKHADSVEQSMCQAHKFHLRERANDIQDRRRK